MTRPDLPILAAFGLAPALQAQVDWERIPMLAHVSYASTAHDTVRGRLVVFGGEALSGLQADTWEWDGTSWLRRTPALSPMPRKEAAAVFDAARGQVVLFGGRTQSNAVLADTWTWDGTTWTLQSPATSPPARSLAAMNFDSARQLVVMFGGGSATAFADTWEWNGAQWTQRQPLHRPPARTGSAMAFDPLRGRTVMFGGFQFQVAPTWLDDTWEWDGSDWIDRTQTWPTPNPLARWGHAMAWDSVRSRVVVFGGSDEPSHYMDTCWEWDGTAWTERVLPIRPVGRLGHGLAPDPANGRLLAFGGESWIGLVSDLWSLDANGWRQLSPGLAPTPGRMPDGDVAWDEGRGVLVWHVLNGTATASAETWEFAGDHWRFAAGWPGSWRYPMRIAYLPSRQRIVLHQGARYPAVPAETWEFDGAMWARLQPAALPDVRLDFAMATDPRLDRLVLFGGSNASGIGAATWLFDGVTWSLATPATSPPARVVHALALDAARHRVVLFGGNNGTAKLGDTWEWDGATWVQRTPAVAPTARESHGMAFDPGRRRVVLHGGIDLQGPRNDTWEWDGTLWVQRMPAHVPPTTWWQVLGHDAQRAVTVLWEVPSGSTWRYSPARPGTWQTFGNACAGSLGAPQLGPEAGQRPYAGSELVLVGERLPGSVAVAALGLSNTSWFGIVPLPANLAVLGYPACDLAVQTDELAVLPVAGGTMQWRIPVPPQSALVGMRFFVQALAFDAGGPNGIAMTAGAEGVLGGI